MSSVHVIEFIYKYLVLITGNKPLDEQTVDICYYHQPQRSFHCIQNSENFLSISKLITRAQSLASLRGQGQIKCDLYCRSAVNHVF